MDIDRLQSFRRITFILYIFFLCVNVSSSSNRNEVVLTDNRYQNLIIAINKKVPVDTTIIDRIKDLFTDGSRRLFEATNRRAYWETITILVPKTWPANANYILPKTESFSVANIVIDLPNERYDDNPYTQQPGLCGHKGEYIHLTPNFILNKIDSEKMWGPVDKLLVHEWGHLQWGLFDEYPTKDTPNFYKHSNNKIEATRCSLTVKGQYKKNGTDDECYLDPETGVYESGCVFSPDTNNQTATASYMYGQFIDSVTSFCHSDPSDPLGYHDVELPHKHNTMCGSRSAWDIILRTQDFKGGVNQPVAGYVDTTPTFTLMQPTDRRVVLVLDTSGSMTGDRIQQLRQSATHYLLYTIDSGSYVGIVHFSTYAQVLSELVEITDDNSREALVAVLPTVATGGTSIGSGVLKGIKVLSRGIQTAKGGSLLLLTDGMNNALPDINDVLDDVENAGVVVDTIAFSSSADPNLENLSDVSGGIAFYFNDIEDISVLNSAFETTVTSRPDQSSQPLPIMLHSDAVATVGGSFSSVESVIVDSDLGKDTVFSFSWINSYSIQVTLTSPDGNLVDQSLQKVDLSLKTINIKIPNIAQDGIWDFSIKSPSTDTVTVNVQSSPQTADNCPITVVPLIGDPSIDYTTEPYTIICVAVTKCYLPVVGADVFVEVESSNSCQTVELLLFDNGAGADVTKDDGIYCGYFLDACGNGRYSVSVKVKSPETNSAFVNMAKATGSLPINPDSTTNKELPVFVPTEMFSRSASGGVIQVTGYVNRPPTTDVISPSKIIDLRVLATSYSEQKVVIQWTAVGDDLDTGNATKYELKMANSFSELLTNFANAREINNNDVIEGDITIIRPAGVVERIGLRVPTRGANQTYFFAIRAQDEASNYGDVSNIVSANMQYIPPIPYMVNSTTVSLTSADKTKVTETVTETVTDVTADAITTAISSTDWTIGLTRSDRSTGPTYFTQTTTSTITTTPTDSTAVNHTVSYTTTLENTTPSLDPTTENPTTQTSLETEEPTSHEFTTGSPTTLASTETPDSTSRESITSKPTTITMSPSATTLTTVPTSNTVTLMSTTDVLTTKNTLAGTSQATNSKHPTSVPVTIPANNSTTTTDLSSNTTTTMNGTTNHTDSTQYPTIPTSPTKSTEPIEATAQPPENEDRTALWASLGAVVGIALISLAVFGIIKFIGKKNKVDIDPESGQEMTSSQSFEDI
ncbi:calcium-activated chloride channel regulator 1-like [Antedon mediterranea]|uniref:calcium-activated chloride channel regulator 1-like n=1 Tax=Antedon mediterranea TaxID=105859 RepID=UPI003AF6B07E